MPLFFRTGVLSYAFIQDKDFKNQKDKLLVSVLGIDYLIDKTGLRIQ